MKTKFSYLDVQWLSEAVWNDIGGARLQNIYQINSRTFLFKFANATSKYMLLVESGIRFHLTSFEHRPNLSPSSASKSLSPFALKIRKHLKGKRVERLYQLGNDRILVMVLGSGEYERHIYFEFYVSGNIILTDTNEMIICILRPIVPGKTNTNVTMDVGYKYPTEHVHIYPCFSTEIVLKTLEEILVSGEPSLTIKQAVLKSLFPFSSSMVADYVLERMERLDMKNVKISSISNAVSLFFDPLMVDRLEKIVDELGMISKSAGTAKGYVLKDSVDGLIDFSPFLFGFPNIDVRMFTDVEMVQDSGSFIIEFGTFSQAVDVYYSFIESQRIQLKQENMRASAVKKLEHVKASFQIRKDILAKYQETCLEKAEAIEEDSILVGQALWVVQSALASGMTWESLDLLVQMEKKRGNHVAEAIECLQLNINRMTLCLRKRSVLVEIDIDLGVHGNAQKWYSERRISIHKAEKTINAEEKALKSAETKIMAELGASLAGLKTRGSDLVHVRKPFWFEKFSWFISSEGYLVIAGQNSQQNEVVVKRHLCQGDFYVHADIQGAASVVIKNCSTRGDMECVLEGQSVLPPPSTLQQAATMAICLSSAWACNVVTGAYWVYANQVSKTPPSGQYIGQGSFMIYGKKNYLLPSHLVYGFGFMFALADQSSIDRHIEERVVRQQSVIEGFGGEENGESSISETFLDGVIEHGFRSVAAPKVLNNQTQKKMMMKNQHVKEKKGLQKVCGSKLEEEVKREVKKPLHIVRGTKGKLKKIKEKYKEQDDDEKIKRMTLLGIPDPEAHLERQKRAWKKEIVEAISTLTLEEEREEEEKEEERIGEVEEDGNVVLNGEEKMSSEDSEDEDVPDSMEFLDFLVPNPLCEDRLLYAIPMCAPWQALQSAIFKVKLVPGNLKRGKAVKSALEICLATGKNYFKGNEGMSKAVSLQTRLIKNVKDEEMVRIMLQNALVVGPSSVIQKLKKDQAQKKKSGSKR